MINHKKIAVVIFISISQTVLLRFADSKTFDTVSNFTSSSCSDKINRDINDVVVLG